jgi:hypothetical protein
MGLTGETYNKASKLSREVIKKVASGEWHVAGNSEFRAPKGGVGVRHTRVRLMAS